MAPQTEFILTYHVVRFCLALYSFVIQFLDLLRQSLFLWKKFCWQNPPSGYFNVKLL